MYHLRVTRVCLYISMWLCECVSVMGFDAMAMDYRS